MTDPTARALEDNGWSIRCKRACCEERRKYWEEAARMEECGSFLFGVSGSDFRSSATRLRDSRRAEWRARTPAVKEEDACCARTCGPRRSLYGVACGRRGIWEKSCRENSRKFFFARLFWRRRFSRGEEGNFYCSSIIKYFQV